MSAPKIAESDDAAQLPRVLRVSAAASWRFLVIVGALYILSRIAGRLSLVVIPVAIALLLAALLAPAVSWLVRRRVPRGLATAVVLVAGLAAVGGVLTFVINAFIAGLPDLQDQVARSINTIRNWLATGPLHLRQDQIDHYVDQALKWVQSNQSRFTSGALATATTFGNFLTGLVLMLFTLIFFLHDGRRIWRFVLRIVPSPVRPQVDTAGSRGFASLVGFVRATVIVAVGDAIGIGVGLAIIGIPLVIPLAALVFLAAFIPIIGALASGAVAVLVALVAKGPIAALLVLAVVLGVQQLEGNVLQPLLVGHAVRLHVLAIVLGISVGVVLAGIVGALLAVPLMAVLNEAVRSLAAGETDDVDSLSPPGSEHHRRGRAKSDESEADEDSDSGDSDESPEDGDGSRES